VNQRRAQTTCLLKWRGKDNRLVETLKAALAEIVLRFRLVPIGESKRSQTKIHFPQPADVGRFGDIRGAPCQIILGGLLLMEETRELRTDDAGNPGYDEDLAAGEPLGLVELRNRVFHVADATEQGDRGGMLGRSKPMALR